MKEVTREWIVKAEEDFLVAEREIEEKPPVYNAVCFHCQQCIEKYLKAILQENDVLIDKTHDLDVLLEKSKKFVADINSYKMEIIVLSAYATEFRYPGIMASEEDAKEAISTTEKAREIIRKHFNISKEET